MPDWLWIAIAVVAVVLVLLVVRQVLARRRRTRRLRSRFGDEYDRKVQQVGSRRRAESRLDDVTATRERIDIRPLNTVSRDRYLARWQDVQSRFVDQPGHALDAADALVTDVMRERGYPIDDFETQADLVALDHPDVVRHYRAAHDVHARTRSSVAGTEEVRVAMIQYRSLFEALLADGGGSNAPARDPGARSV